MEAAAAKPQPPAISYDGVAKAERDEEAYQSHNTGVAPPSSTSSYTESIYSQPPPPYSHGAPPSAHAAEQATPADSRRASGEKESGNAVSVAPVKQSLPSISEALGVDNQGAYQPSLSSQPVPIPPIHPSQASLHKSIGPASPVPAMRSYVAEPPRPFAANSKYQHADVAQPLHPDVRPALHVSTLSGSKYPPPLAAQPYALPPTQSASYERGPQGQLTYGYAPYPARYQPGGPAKVAGGPIYQPSTSAAAPPPKLGPYRGDDRAYHTDSIKRHLDAYDFEAALNDISATSSHLGDFGLRYRTLMHRGARDALHLSMLPSSTEIEDMIAKSRAQTDALLKIRETIMTHQATHDQEVAEQTQQKASAYDMMPPHSGDSDDGKSYTGADAKKRRGRAAPPGRCHSCNRAETPEWRRGPDGARTLCNACGLHYAKLTRKAHTGSAKPGLPSSSNLRPKEQM